MSSERPVGLTRDQYHRYWWTEPESRTPVIGPLPSVTTITGVALAKPGLLGWARRETALYAVRNLDLITRMVNDFGAEQAANAVKTVTNKEAADKAAMGTRIHLLAEAVLRGQPVEPSADEAPFVASLERFMGDWKPRWLAAEEMVVSLRHGYAGTLDAIAVLDGVTTLLDIKTGSGIYDEFALQLAAYANADFFGRPGTTRRYRIPKVERFAILHVRPEGYQLVPFAVSDEDFRTFLACLALWRWAEGHAKTVKGQALVKEGVAAA